MKERIVLFDIARSLCVLEIVGFWHMLDYINCNNIYVRTIGCGITYSVLACFTFISGFFLGQKETSTKKFYYSRLKRFFLPLLLTSLCFLCIGWFDSIQLFIFTITGLTESQSSIMINNLKHALLNITIDNYKEYFDGAPQGKRL